jgi:CDP-glycerol glycerophosphotransferase
MTRVLRTGGAGVIPAHPQRDGSRLVADWSAGKPLGFRVHRAGVGVRDPRVSGRELVGRLTDDHRTEVEAVHLRAGSLHASAAPDDAGEFRVALPVDDHGLPPGQPRTWRVRARYHDGTSHGLVPAVELPVPVQLGPATNRNGELVVTEWSRGVEADHVVVQDDGTLLVRGRVHGDADALRLVADGGGIRGEGPACEVRKDGRFEGVLVLCHELYRFGRLPLPVGEYDVLALLPATGDQAAAEVPVRIATSMGATLPVPVDTGVHEGRVLRGPESRARVSLVRPLGPARGRFQQHRLRTAPRSADLERCLVVRSYSGELATDHGVAVQAELRRRGSDLPVYWAVHDHGIPVPEGGLPVVWNSREWFALLARAKYYLDNTHQPDYHRKPEGQVIIHAPHGYPFKRMGHPLWEALQLSRERIESLDARTAEWDYLVSPARYATGLLVRDLGYTGEVLEIGYPRNDVLLSPDATGLRAEVRTSLGVRDDQTAVLYAPSVREYLPEDRRSALPGLLDLDLASRALGDDVVILVRGHAHDGRVTSRMPPAPGRVDVTDYPEVSDLLLASDAAVVDYSSLRFDFGVTGKPMVFHVPDLQRSRDAGGWLLDFEPTAPGPLVSTTEEVVRHLADLDAVRREYAAAYASFRADFLDLDDGHAARRLVDAVFAPRGDA